MALPTYGICRKTSREHVQKVPGYYPEQRRLDGLLGECALVLYVHYCAKKEKWGFLQNFSSKRAPFFVEQTVHSVKKVSRIGQWNTNYLLFIQIYFIVFKVGPFRNNTLTICQRIIQSSKHLLNAFFGIDFSSRREFSFISSIDSKRVLRSGNLSSERRKKSAGAVSGEYGGCSVIFVEFLAFTRLSFWRRFRSFGTSRAVVPT